VSAASNITSKLTRLQELNSAISTHAIYSAREHPQEQPRQSHHLLRGLRCLLQPQRAQPDRLRPDRLRLPQSAQEPGRLRELRGAGGQEGDHEQRQEAETSLPGRRDCEVREGLWQVGRHVRTGHIRA
jgi:hypothetical protein